MILLGPVVNMMAYELYVALSLKFCMSMYMYLDRDNL